MATIARVPTTASPASLARKRRAAPSPARAAPSSPAASAAALAPVSDAGPDPDPDSASPAVAASSQLTSLSSSSSSSSPPRPAPPSRLASSVYPSFLQPRVAVVLKVPQPWHPWLFALRLCSILPALWWGLPSALQLLLHLLPGTGRVLVVRSGCPAPLCTHGADADAAVPYTLTDGALANIWCFACGYLSFFFTDCLMSRWLINYTPQATMVRLLTINAVNAYLSLSVLSLTGGFDDPRLLLPGWIGIATTLTVCYHITHQKINIRKETVTSINVFSIASYITMVILLVHMHSSLADYPTMPLVARARHLWNETAAVLTHVKGAIERADL